MREERHQRVQPSLISVRAWGFGSAHAAVASDESAMD